MKHSTLASMREWLARPEWNMLTELLRSVRAEVSEALIAADPGRATLVAGLQAEIKTLDYFLNGDVQEALLERQRGKDKNET